MLADGEREGRIVRSIVAEPCPYRKEELTLALQHCWREMESVFAERAKAMYALQERGLINLDQYPSDEERAKQLNLHQDICQFSPDSIQRGRQLWEES